LFIFVDFYIKLTGLIRILEILLSEKKIKHV